MNLKKYNLLFIVTGFLIVWVLFNQRPGYIKTEGETQGTFYHITYKLKKGNKNLKDEFDKRLHHFDLSLSTYDTESLITKINSNAATQVDRVFIECFTEAQRIWKASDGLFDITIAPLASAYGFGPGKRQEVSDELIDSLLQFVGMDKITLNGNIITKDNPNITLNVNAIAQGYAVDLLCGFLDSLGSKNYMVEVGGELKTKGKNPKKDMWRIGIDKPFEGNMNAGAEIQAILTVNNMAVATSGNYRKFYEKDGKKYTHTINPLTGETVQSNLLSATILTDKCITADAFATACMASGLEKAKELVKENNLEAYLLYGNDKGEIKIWMTDYVKNNIKTNE